MFPEIGKSMRQLRVVMLTRLINVALALCALPAALTAKPEPRALCNPAATAAAPAEKSMPITRAPLAST